MRAEFFDVLVIGARCAGAPLATYLAASGVRVLLIDKAPLPSNQPLSTHLISSAGMREAAILGCADAIRAQAPPIERLRIAVCDAHTDITLRSPSICLSRRKLDSFLQAGAQVAGAVIRDRTRLISLLWENDRVVGAQLRQAGREYRVYANLVVGADGPHSCVAEQARAPSYLAYPFPRAAYWAYWPKPKAWGDLGFGAYTEYQPGRQRFVFECDDERLVILNAHPLGNKELRQQQYAEDLKRSAIIAPLIEGATPIGPIMGLRKGSYFFRKPIGPGFALVGDAGLHEDPVSASGISNAFRDARALAEAIIQQTPEAMDEYWHRRDKQSIEGYLLGKLVSSKQFTTPLMARIISHIDESPALKGRMARHLDKGCPAASVLSLRDLWKILRHKPDLRLLYPLIRLGKTLEGYERLARQSILR